MHSFGSQSPTLHTRRVSVILFSFELSLATCPHVSRWQRNRYCIRVPDDPSPLIERNRLASQSNHSVYLLYLQPPVDRHGRCPLTYIREGNERPLIPYRYFGSKPVWVRRKSLKLRTPCHSLISTTTVNSVFWSSPPITGHYCTLSRVPPTGLVVQGRHIGTDTNVTTSEIRTTKRLGSRDQERGKGLDDGFLRKH